jgi:hypothetical protein
MPGISPTQTVCPRPHTHKRTHPAHPQVGCHMTPARHTAFVAHTGVLGGTRKWRPAAGEVGPGLPYCCWLRLSSLLLPTSDSCTDASASDSAGRACCVL